MIADLESENREIEFEEFLDAITSKLGDKETKAGKEIILMKKELIKFSIYSMMIELNQ